MGLTATNGWAPGLLATVDHIWGGDDHVVAATLGSQPAEWTVIERYRVAASLSRARFLLPETSRRAAVGSVRSYNQLRLPRTRAARTVLGGALSVGGASLLRDRIAIAVDPRIDVSAHRDHVLTRYLAAELDAPDLVFAAGVHSQTPNSKPTIQGFRADGTPAAFIKVGWNDVTREQVRNEAAAVRTVGGRMATIAIPSLRSAGSWGNRELLVSAPMPATVQPWADPDHAPDADVISELAAAGASSTATISGSAQVARLRAETHTLGWDAEVRSAVTALLDRIEQRFGGIQVRYGAWHGDWVPWNLACNGTGLVVWDWEQFRNADIPIGFDSLHWHFQVGFVSNRAELGDAVDRSRRLAAGQLSVLQTTEAVEACHALYVVELAARYEAMRAAGAGTTPRFHPQINAVLAAIGTSW